MTVFDKLRNCITEPRCRDCEGIPGVCEVDHQSVRIPKALALDVLNELKEQEAEAKWIYGEDEKGVDGWHCSECNFFEPWFYDFTEDIDFIRFYGHCPSCGRKMTSYTGKATRDGR